MQSITIIYPKIYFLVLFSVFVRQKVIVTENITFVVCVRNPVSGLLQIDQKSGKWQWRHNFSTWRQRQIFLTLFLFSSLGTGPSSMSISSLVLELWQFLFIRDWPEIWKSKISRYEFCSISRDWGELGIPNLVRTSLIKCYWMLQNASVTAFTTWVFKRNQEGEGN